MKMVCFAALHTPYSGFQFENVAAWPTRWPSKAIRVSESNKGVRNEWHCRDHKTDSCGEILRHIHATGEADGSFPSHATP